MSKCFFMGTNADSQTLSNRDGRQVENEIGCRYWITGEAEAAYQKSHKLSEQHNLRCLTETIKLNKQGLIPFWSVNSSNEEIKENPKVVIKSIDSVKSTPIIHREKDIDILKLLAEKLDEVTNPFAFIGITKQERYLLSIYDRHEFSNWIVHLVRQGFIELDTEPNAYLKELHAEHLLNNFIDIITKSNCFKLTVKGWKHVYGLSLNKKSRIAFIAMAFTDYERKTVSAALREQIKSTIESLGWAPKIVDEVEHNDGIMDKVIALINESHFIVAELTFHKTGVYYEAGYAKGKGLPVIHIVKKDEFEKCHFDIKHLNLIVWESLEDLDKKLRNRILASIGRYE